MELRKTVVTSCMLVIVIIFSVDVMYWGLVFDVAQVTSSHLPT